MHVEDVAAFAPDCINQRRKEDPIIIISRSFFIFMFFFCNSFQERERERETKKKLTQRTVIPGHLARWTTPLVWDATDPTDVAFVVLVMSGVACVPAPLGDGAPMFDVHFHRALMVWMEFENVF